MKNNEYALIVAGGKGTRMKASLPMRHAGLPMRHAGLPMRHAGLPMQHAGLSKQFLEVNGLPVLMHTINAFFRYSETIRVILVLPEEDFGTWEALCQKHHYTRPVILQKGGDSRFQSVKNGLEKIDGDGLVAIHDGVRPLVRAEIIATSFRLAAVHQSAVAAVRLKESIRITDQDNTKAVDRSRFRLIQTPQTFQVALIRQAYTIKEDPSLTDDASVAERAGHTISLFEGSYENIKITTPEDLIVAGALLDAAARETLKK